MALIVDPSLVVKTALVLPAQMNPDPVTDYGAIGPVPGGSGAGSGSQ